MQNNTITWKQKTGLFFCMTCLYLLVRFFHLNDVPHAIQTGMIFCLSLLGIYMFICKRRGKYTDELAIGMILIAGIIMRIGYMLYTGCEVRGHDVWEMDADSYGHAAYILNIMQRGQLPQTNTVQFYQQPMFYLLGSAVSFLVNGILRSSEAYDLVDAAKLVSCMASCMTLFLAEKLGTICGLKARGKKVLLLFVAFSPTFYLTGGAVAPDALTVAFMTAEFVYTLVWEAAPTWKNTCILALLYGFGISTKISCGTVAIFTAGVFLRKLYQAIKEKEALGYIKKYICFGVISFPLGLWYSVRNYVRFGQSLGYVVRIPDDNILYRGNRSIVVRFLWVDFPNIMKDVYADVATDYNALVYFLKSSLFGEFRFQIPVWIPAVLLFTTVAIACIIAVAVVWQIRNRTGYGNRILIMAAIFYGSMIWFGIKYPFSCSLDYRYMGLLSVLAGMLLGFYMDAKKEAAKNVSILFYVFAAFSILTYVTCQ